ncbi:MAG: rhodanese-like domain-containing protein [Verrucomicrobiota bacterium]|nr:rhodanese-like domain-containing protein [Verrucomicrobiota bacterium]
MKKIPPGMIAPFATLSLLAVTGLCLSFYTLRWTMVKRQVHHDFPQVRQMNTRQLADWLRDKRAVAPVLLDVRTSEEFNLSHLQNARRVEPGSDPTQLNLPADAPIVTYCSVGYRSSAFSKSLIEAGFKNVRNLEGSIFQWVNEGRPVVADDHVVDKVHPYNEFWGRLLVKSHRADVAALGSAK